MTIQSIYNASLCKYIINTIFYLHNQHLLLWVIKKQVKNISNRYPPNIFEIDKNKNEAENKSKTQILPKYNKIIAKDPTNNNNNVDDIFQNTKKNSQNENLVDDIFGTDNKTEIKNNEIIENKKTDSAEEIFGNSNNKEINKLFSSGNDENNLKQQKNIKDFFSNKPLNSVIDNKTKNIKKNPNEEKNIQNKKNENKGVKPLNNYLDEFLTKEENNIDDIFGSGNNNGDGLFG